LILQAAGLEIGSGVLGVANVVVPGKPGEVGMIVLAVDGVITAGSFEQMKVPPEIHHNSLVFWMIVRPEL